MTNQNRGKVRIYAGWALRRLALLAFDVLAVNLSYYLTLCVRFFVNGEFRAVALEKYLPAFGQFAPWYTAACVVVFIAFRLYNNRWKHAGLHDLNRIFLASAVTAVIHVAGTLAFVCRMPLTYYFIGAALQFALIAASRFGYRLFVLEMNRLRRLNSASLNVMIVGVGETARILRGQIESDSANVARPVCIFSPHDAPAGKLINGLPVLTGVDRLAEHIEKYRVRCVILADALMPDDVRMQLRSACHTCKVEVQDFSGFLARDGGGVTLRRLMELARGPVEIRLEDAVQRFDNGEQALMSFPGAYEVKAVYGSADALGVEIARRAIILNDTNEQWIRDAQTERGEEISFF